MSIRRRFLHHLMVPVAAGVLVAPAVSLAQAAPRPGTLGVPRPATPPRQPQPGTRGAPAPGAPGTPFDTSRTLAVFGVVYDSLAQAPLADATVQMVNEADRAQSFTAVTDSTGRYRIPGVRPGRYLAGFFHEMLDAFGLAPSAMRVLVQPDTAARLDFGVPGPRSVKAALCGPNVPGDSTGALVGLVRDADAGAPVGNAKVVVTWNELKLSPAGIQNVHRRYPARVKPTGSYVICGLPSDGVVEANAEAPGRMGGVIEVQVAARSVVRRDFALGDSTTAIAVQLPDTAAVIEKRPANPITVARGSARLAGTVRSREGRVLPGARLQIWGSGVTGQTTTNGAFALSGLPAGTFSLEVRAIGYQPKRVAVDLSAKRPANVDVVLDKQVATLQGMIVTADRNKAEKDYNGFLERSKNGFGKYLTEEDIERRNPFVMTDLMRTTPGMQVSPNGGFGYVVRGRGGCTPEIFIDGMKVMQGADEIDNLVRPQEVAGVEVYSGSAGVPAQYAGAAGGSCGVILVWTKRGGPPAKRP